MAWSKNLRKRIKFQEPLKAHTTFKIGGPAELFFQPQTFIQLQEMVKSLRGADKKPLILGAGSNLLVSDKGVAATVIKLDSAAFRGIKRDGNMVVVGAGKPLNQLLAYCAKHGLSGLEFMAGIPGTVGGGLAMNAGVRVNKKNPAIGDLVETALVMDYNGKLLIFDRAKMKFGYRSSSLSRFIILSAGLKLTPGNKETIAKVTAGYILRRKASQDYSFPNAGCIFKNPPGDSAGRLIDSCGLKSRRAGGAQISPKHANFILNTGGAAARDVLELVRLVRKEVKEKHKIVLKPEIKIWK
jgi:UDP-N-acetylmuramate dehydrogenase